MTAHAHPIGDVHPIEHRPGIRGRNLIGTEHGFTSLFVSELLMEQGASIPLHTHPTEEALVVTEGALTIRVGDQTVVAEAESVVRIPPGVPHAVRNEGHESAHAFGAAAWNRATWFTEATTYLEGEARTE
jgi:quercetin dioxygenase-like cupin family protein